MSEKWKKICSVILVIAMLCSVLNLSVGTDPTAESVYAATADVGDVKVSYEVDDSITDMYNVAVTYYDYLSDNELKNGWKAVSYYGGNYEDGWTQYTSFNTALANYYSSNSLTTTGLYFGNLLSSDKSTWYRAYEVANEIAALRMIYNNYDYRANNSNYLYADYYSYSYSAQGLVYNQLDEDGNLQIANGVVAPWFSESFLSNTSYSSDSYSGGTLGKVLTSRFPLRAETTNGITTYVYDSSTTVDYVYSVNDTFYYGTGAGSGYQAITDAANVDWGSTTASNGFFPFNYNTGYNNDWLDYGFGAEIEIEFNLPSGGVLTDSTGAEQAITFNFTGDDDIWIFIDGQLVLDMGGAHSMASGTLDFKELTTTISTGTATINSDESMNAVSLKDALGVSNSSELDPTVSHTMKIFYMERGMINSNLKITTTIVPVTNQLQIAKTVDVTNVNAGLQTAVASADSFDITLSAATSSDPGTKVTASDKSYTLSGSGTASNGTTDTNGVLTLSGGQTAVFSSQFDDYEEGTIYATEDNTSGGSKISYTTTWVAEDLQNEVSGSYAQIDSGSGTSASFTYDYTDVSHGTYTPLINRLTYTNTPEVGTLSVTKAAVDTDGSTSYTADTTTEFSYTILVDLGTGTGVNAYQAKDLTYKLYDATTGNSVDSNAAHTATNGVFTLKAGQTAKFEGIPTGADVKITESTAAGYTLQSVTQTDAASPLTAETDGSYKVTVSTDTGVTFTNKKSSATESLTAKKTLDSGTSGLTAGQFTFTLTGTSSNAAGTSITVSNAADGTITFPTLTFTAIGEYTYVIREDIPSNDKTYVYDQSIYTVTVTVEDDGNGGYTTSTEIVKTQDTDGSTITPGTTANSITFANTTNTASLTIQKILVNEKTGNTLESSAWPESSGTSKDFTFILQKWDGTGYSACTSVSYSYNNGIGIENGATDSSDGSFTLTVSKGNSSADELKSVVLTFDGLIIGETYRVVEQLDSSDSYKIYSITVGGTEYLSGSSSIATTTNGTITTYASDVTIAGGTNAVVFKNYPLSSIKIVKQGEDTSGLSDVTFKLEKLTSGTAGQAGAEWTQVGTTQTTTSSGTVDFTQLQAGTYRITEVGTASGYTLLAEPIILDLPYAYQSGDIVNGVTVNSGGTTYHVTYTITNGKTFDLPFAGVSGIGAYLAAGIFILIIAGAILFLRRKKWHA